jgi:hypothetical protein
VSRQTYPIVFGAGLDRATGTASVSPSSMEVAENVVLENGRVYPRKGMGEVRSNLGGCAYVAGMHPDRNTLRSVFVAGFGTPGEASHKLEVWVGTGSGRNAEKLGDWADPCESVEKARVIACQSGPYVFLAHDEPSIDRRAPTVVVNVEAGTITELSAAWAGGDNKIRFRGVTAWLDYVSGWGFGTNVEDKSHMVRISSVTDGPLVYEEDSWQTFGQAGEAILFCAPARVGLGGALLVRKEVDTYLLTGYSFDTFIPTQVGSLFGLAASRLSVSDGDTEWSWSLEGPREGQAGSTTDISWPLGLHPWPTAEDIAASGRIDNGFAVYQPNEGVVHFCFHDWLYSYTLATKQWAHSRLAAPVHCGAILYGRSGYEGPSRGYPDYGTATLVDSDSYEVAWADLSPEGDETVEVWYRRGGGAWALGATASISLAPEATLNGLYTGTYEVAIRYKRDGQYSAAGDVSGQATYDYTGWPVQVLRNTANTTVGATLIHTSSGNTGTYNDDAPGTGETTVYWFVRNIFPDTSTGTASAGYPRWIGPNAPAGLAQFLTNVIASDADYYKYSVDWDAPPSGTVTKVEDDYLCPATYANQSTTAADAVSVTDKAVTKASGMSEDGSEDIVSATVRVRHERTQFAVMDYSEWATVLVDIRIHSDETAYQSCP